MILRYLLIFVGDRYQLVVDSVSCCWQKSRSEWVRDGLWAGVGESVFGSRAVMSSLRDGDFGGDFCSFNTVALVLALFW